MRIQLSVSSAARRSWAITISPPITASSVNVINNANFKNNLLVSRCMSIISSVTFTLITWWTMIAPSICLTGCTGRWCTRRRRCHLSLFTFFPEFTKHVPQFVVPQVHLSTGKPSIFHTNRQKISPFLQNDPRGVGRNQARTDMHHKHHKLEASDARTLQKCLWVAEARAKSQNEILFLSI